MIHNIIPPFVYYALYIVNETPHGPVFTAIQPDSFVLSGYATVAITVSASIQTLLNSPQQYERSHKTFPLEVHM